MIDFQYIVKFQKYLSLKQPAHAPRQIFVNTFLRALYTEGVIIAGGKRGYPYPPQRENPLSSSRVSSSLARLVYLARACCMVMALTSEPGYPGPTFRVSTASYFVISSYTEKVDLPTGVRLQIHIALSPGGGGGLNKVLYRKAPPRGPTPCSLIYHL